MVLPISWTAGLDSLFLARSLLGPLALPGDFSSFPVVYGGSVLHIIGVLVETFPGQLYVLREYWCPHQKTNQKLRMDVHTSFHKGLIIVAVWGLSYPHEGYGQHMDPLMCFLT